MDPAVVVTHEDAERIADILAIPQAGREQFRLSLRLTMDVWATGHHRRQIFSDKAALRRSLKRIEKAVKDLADALESCPEGATQHLISGWPENAATPADFVEAFDAMRLASDGAADDLADVERGRKLGRKLGRPKGSTDIRKEPTVLMVRCLLRDIYQAGGPSPSLDATVGTGTILDAIEVMRSLLPGSRPPTVSAATIQPILTEYRRRWHWIKNPQK